MSSLRAAIISDIHGNRHALEAVLADIAASACEEIWCLGDVVGYGAEPEACVDLVRASTAVCLAGNHDLAVVGSVAVDEFSEPAREAALWTRETLSAQALAFLESLAPKNEDEAAGLYHASPRDPIWEYVLSPLQAALCFDVAAQRVSLIGHTHVALEFHRPEHEMATGETCAAGVALDVSEGHWLLNPGSVGQPRDGDPRAAWMELDTGAWVANYRRVKYDVEGAQWAIRAARLPDSLAERLAGGQ